MLFFKENTETKGTNKNVLGDRYPDNSLFNNKKIYRIPKFFLKV